MNRLNQIEALLEQCEQDLKTLKNINQSLKTIEENRQRLADYYENHYLNDYDDVSKQNYRILDQDSIWNNLTDQHYEKISLLKTIVENI